MSNASAKKRSDLTEILGKLAASGSDETAWESAWEDLYRHMWPWVLAHNYRFLQGARGAAEDASQEVFFRLARYCPFDEFEDTNSFEAYIRQVCRNVSSNFLNRVRKRRETDIAEFIQREDESAISLKRQIEAEQEAELQRLMTEIFGSLDEYDGRLMGLIVEGHSLAEVAEKLGLSYSATAIRLYRLRKKLRNYFSRNNISPA